jgi:hypothetical protein
VEEVARVRRWEGVGWSGGVDDEEVRSVDGFFIVVKKEKRIVQRECFDPFV